MESPPSSTWSEGFILSDDSGLLLTNESTSNSGESRNGRKFFHFEDSDCSEKSLSQDDSIEGNENFNTLKKAPPNWTDIITITKPIEPPLEFQDKPMLEYFSDKLSQQIIKKAIHEYNENESKKQKNFYRVCFPPAPYSPHHHHHHHHINSRSSSRLSSSHNSLSLSNTQKVDDSTFIKQAVSHDTLISDLYNVPFDSDIYAVPIDVVKHHKRSQQQQQQQKKRRRNTAWGYKDLELKHYRMLANKNRSIELRKTLCFQRDNKRHSVAGTSTASQVEPIHVTLQEIRQYLQTLYSGSSDSSSEPKEKPQKTTKKINNNNNNNNNKYTDPIPINVPPLKKNIFIHIKNKKIKDSSCDNTNLSTTKKDDKRRKCKSPTKVFSLKQMLCNVFRFKKFFTQPDRVVVKEEDDDVDDRKIDDGRSNISGRALPPLPKKEEIIGSVLEQEQSLDFATSIQRVKDYGWYWGPISSEAAEKILSNEPDGSFIVRDSSDDHYIFSLTFKLNNCVRHVRIEHDQGNFSFGSCTKFKSQTIVEFIENAVEHSRSGRYLFFLHRRPLIGPVRVQLLHPLSRFKQVQTLQHICRFVIHKNVRRDLIPSLPLPRRIIDYLNTPYYYTEFLVDVRETEKEQSGNHGNLNNNQHNVQLVPVNNYIIVNNNNNQ